jgi:hypothetical protein
MLVTEFSRDFTCSSLLIHPCQFSSQGRKAKLTRHVRHERARLLNRPSNTLTIPKIEKAKVEVVFQLVCQAHQKNVAVDRAKRIKATVNGGDGLMVPLQGRVSDHVLLNLLADGTPHLLAFNGRDIFPPVSKVNIHISGVYEARGYHLTRCAKRSEDAGGAYQMVDERLSGGMEQARKQAYGKLIGVKNATSLLIRVAFTAELVEELDVCLCVGVHGSPLRTVKEVRESG